MTKRNPYKCRFCGIVDIIKVRNNDCGKCCVKCGTTQYVMARRCGQCYRLAQPKRQYRTNAYNVHMRAKYLAQTIWTIGLIIGFVVLHTLWRLDNVPSAAGPNMELVKHAAAAICLTIIAGGVIISTYSKGEWK